MASIFPLSEELSLNGSVRGSNPFLVREFFFLTFSEKIDSTSCDDGGTRSNTTMLGFLQTRLSATRGRLEVSREPSQDGVERVSVVRALKGKPSKTDRTSPLSPK